GALGGRKRREPLGDAHAAGGAARAAAADRGVRQARIAHRLEDSPADRRRDDAAARVAQLIGPAEPCAQPAREQRGREQRPERELESLAPLYEARALVARHAP